MPSARAPSRLVETQPFRVALGLSLVAAMALGLAACSSEGSPTVATTGTTGAGNGTTITGAGVTNPTVPARPSLLAPTGDAAARHPVDGIPCQGSEQVLFHIHAHLAVLVRGQQRYIPYGIGIGPPLQLEANGGFTGGPFVTGGSCFSWLHTHDDSGIIHIESPVHRTYTLGDFFDVWGQPLGPTRVGGATGQVTIFVNGRQLAAGTDPRAVALVSHELIGLDVGSPAPAPPPFRFPAGY